VNSQAAFPLAKQQRSAETADILLMVAIERLREGGLDACTVPEVAKGANRAAASIYRRFGDKDGLLKAAAGHYLAAVAAHNAAALADPALSSLDLTQRIDLIVTGTIEGRRRDWRIIAAVRQFARLSDDVDFKDRIAALQQTTQSLIRDFLMRSSSEIRCANPDTAVMFSVEMLTAYIELTLQSGESRLSNSAAAELSYLMRLYLMSAR
jgi:AcrR family transcriptional regulator